MGVYGNCPICGKPGKYRERRPGGNDICEAGHEYPSSKAVHPPPTPTDWSKELADLCDMMRRGGAPLTSDQQLLMAGWLAGKEPKA